MSYDIPKKPTHGTCLPTLEIISCTQSIETWTDENGELQCSSDPCICFLTLRFPNGDPFIVKMDHKDFELIFLPHLEMLTNNTTKQLESACNELGLGKDFIQQIISK